jgi:oxygen-independent coproporphyrinogen-3 oxidase
MDDFLCALHHEVELYSAYGDQETFETIFFGGGTPSLLEPSQLETILSHLYKTFHIEEDAEITVETNPGTVTREKLLAYRSLGVNRLSIGVQSFHEDELRFLSRIHDSGQAIACVELAREAGLENLNIDLIFSLPGQTAARWEANLRTALGLHPEHISAYSLIVEDNTPLARMVRSKQVSPNPVEMEAELYELTMQIMTTHGFEHYEVSNYARPGYRSRHNYNYWGHANYLGFGPSAHSFWKERGALHGRRWWNIANISTYSERLQSRRLPIASEEEVAVKGLANERIFLGLRSDGLNLKRLSSEFGVELPAGHHNIIHQLVAENIATLENELLRLTPKGFLLCDEVSERLML